MHIDKLIRPYSEKHSIKEVVFTMYFDQSIDDFSTLSNLSEKVNKKQFIQPIQLSSVTYEINTGNPTDIKSKDETRIGFLWQKKNNDTSSIKQSIQIRNANDQSFLSFHELEYERWQNFKNDYLAIIDDVCNIPFSDNQTLAAFNLTYIDEFIWISDDSIDLNLIFNHSSDYLPAYFFDSFYPNIDIAAIKSEPNSAETLTERLAIDIQRTLPNPVITISHTVAITLAEVQDLIYFCQNHLEAYLEKTHAFNKNTLSNLLNTEVQTLIHLPIKS